MIPREIPYLDLKIKLTIEYLNNGGIQEIYDIGLLQDLKNVKRNPDGNVDPASVSSRVNSFMLGLLHTHMIPPPCNQNIASEYQSTFQKSIFFNQHNIDTIEQFDEIYDYFKNKENTLFRGQSEAKWRLYSKLQRFWIKDKLFENHSYPDFIKKLVHIGKSNFSEQIREVLKTNHADTLNSISVLGFLQHHGCPTPLLDWTYNYRIALFFAIDNINPNIGSIEIENYFSLYYIEEEFFEGGNLKQIFIEGLEIIEQEELERLIDDFSNGDDKFKQDMQERFSGRKIFDRKKIHEVGLVSKFIEIENLMKFPISYFSDKDIGTDILFSLNNSENIVNQQGVFTWNSIPYKPIELVGAEQYNKKNSYDDFENYYFCSCFNVNKSLVNHIKKKLEQDRITMDYIYPNTKFNTWHIYEQSKNMNQ